jgi:muramoyltetrapeptide carboxypeptidase
MPEYTVIDCIREIIDDVDVPVMYNLQAGHGEKNITIPFGTNCIMDTEKKSITFDIDR